MADTHERYEQLALGHVLGGLHSEEAAVFRAHLVECRQCRMRVAELRDIAADLAATEREERRRAVVATQVAHRDDDTEPPGRRLTLPVWWRQVAVGTAVALVLGILFWNYHLRRVTGEYAGTVEAQSEVLAVLAGGTRLSVSTSEDVTGLAAVLDGEVAVTLDGLPALATNEVVAVWSTSPDGATLLRTFPAPLDPSLPFLVDGLGEAEDLVVTVETARGRQPEQPSSRRLATVTISGVGGGEAAPTVELRPGPTRPDEAQVVPVT